VQQFTNAEKGYADMFFLSEPEFENRLSVVHAAKEKYLPNRWPNRDATLAINAVRLFRLSPALRPEGEFWDKRGSGAESAHTRVLKSLRRETSIRIKSPCWLRGG